MTGRKVAKMLFLVNEEIKSLTAIGKNNVEWTQDLLGEHNASYSYDEDKGMYTMSADDYEWWSDIVDNSHSRVLRLPETTASSKM